MSQDLFTQKGNSSKQFNDFLQNVTFQKMGSLYFLNCKYFEFIIHCWTRLLSFLCSEDVYRKQCTDTSNLYMHHHCWWRFFYTHLVSVIFLIPSPSRHTVYQCTVVSLKLNRGALGKDIPPLYVATFLQRFEQCMARTRHMLRRIEVSVNVQFSRDRNIAILRYFSIHKRTTPHGERLSGSNSEIFILFVQFLKNCKCITQSKELIEEFI